MTPPASLNDEDIANFPPVPEDLEYSSRNSIYQPPIKVQSPKPRLFALIIGINLYENVNPLRGAVADARAVRNYLEAQLDVPEERIHMLLNQSASRSSILAAFARLRDDPYIDKGDPILIYYAGHGSEAIFEPENGHTKTLVPQDYSNDPVKTIYPIPYSTIGTLLTQIAAAKGNNITVIFDCCHSSPGKQCQNTTGTLVRSVDSTLTSLMDRDMDGDVLMGTQSYQKKGGTSDNLHAYILISACSPSEKARENQGRGAFSTALLKLLRTVPPNELRYSELLSRMDQIPGQNPSCEGAHQNRALFDGKVFFEERICHTINSTAENGRFFLGSGAIHGITKGSEFSLYESADNLSEPPLGHIKVEILKPSYAIMQPSDLIDLRPTTTSVIAVQVKAGEREDVRFYCPGDEEYLVCHEAFISVTGNPSNIGWNIAMVETPDDAHIKIEMQNSRVIFFIKDPAITQYGITRLFYDTALVVEEIAPVIKSAEHYFFALNHSVHNPAIVNDIQLEIYKLQRPFMLPAGPNLYQDNIFDLVVEEGDVPYGMKLTNNSSFDLYPNLFYFDNSDLSIVSYYQPQSVGGDYNSVVPLGKNGGTLTIGYGSSRALPLSYYLRDGQNFDIGFLKIFLSIRPADLSTLPQPTPFERSRPFDKRPILNLWGTILIPAIQRRYPRESLNHAACTHCGHTVDPGLDLGYLQIENGDLRCELDIHRKMASREIQNLEKGYQDILAELERRKAELAGLTDISRQQPGRRKNSRKVIQATRGPEDGSSPALADPQHSPRARLSLRMSLSERVKRLLRSKA
ncbi:hypothetical protein HYPSUDRAFT_41353 [Hypholoma sublateritium FD-334 SS-4]|uniref:Peptidase C14 caspase domain-containing protein n=1 Tax=Hypholoma sublateritium (strain FD-334 SS-4) TaxID=945553 RepID=A0A0D2P0H2_HYPSF|nr:hypothetical protein HYPSUDRAFT_41353 [Hypholoma sublateritium FD-334 SS-4]